MGDKMKEYIITPDLVVRPDLAEIIAVDFPGKELKLDERLFLYERFTPLLRSGIKKTTVRYGGGKIRVPASYSLPLIETREGDKEYENPDAGHLEIARLVIKPFGELTEEDGLNDGFPGKNALIEVIEKIYGRVPLDNLVSIYHVKLL